MRGIVSWATAAVLALTMPFAAQAQSAGEIGVGVFTFTSGPAGAYGVPGRNAAELMFDQINKAGGVAGMKLNPVIVDEAQGTDGVVAEFRRLAADENNLAMVAALSSGNCLALAPVAEQLKTPMLAWNCDTHQLFKDHSYNYVYRTNSSTIPEFFAYALYLLDKKPDLKTVAIINPDYAFGHDAANIFKAALKAFKPDVEVVVELFPRLGTASYNTEISRIAAAKPDVVFSNLWGADLENFTRQALARGIFQNSQVVLALGETILQRIELPDGVIVGVLGDGWWHSPTAQQKPMTKEFVEEYRKRYNEYPVFPSFKMANTILSLKSAIEKAAEKAGGKPSRDDLIAVLKGMEAETFTGTVKLRDDNDGLVDQLVGVTKKTDEVPFPVIADMVRYPADKVTPPLGADPIEWISGLKPEYLADLPKPGSQN